MNFLLKTASGILQKLQDLGSQALALISQYRYWHQYPSWYCLPAGIAIAGFITLVVMFTREALQRRSYYPPGR